MHNLWTERFQKKYEHILKTRKIALQLSKRRSLYLKICPYPPTALKKSMDIQPPSTIEIKANPQAKKLNQPLDNKF